MKQKCVREVLYNSRINRFWKSFKKPSNRLYKNPKIYKTKLDSIKEKNIPESTSTECQCTCIDSDGNKYVGGVKNGKKNGNGKSEYIGGISINGYWENGNLVRGKLVDEYDIQTYLGSFKDNLKNGFGIFTQKFTSSSIKYIGEFNNDFREGIGRCNWEGSEKVKYIGNFLKDKASGFGKSVTFNEIYTGYYENHKKNGFGYRLYMKCDKQYKEYGYWKDGKLIKSMGEEYYLVNYKQKFQTQLEDIINSFSEKLEKYKSSNIESEFGDLELEN